MPCRDSLDLQKSLHINAKVQMESRVTSDSQRKKKSPVVGPSRAVLTTPGILGPDGLCLAWSRWQTDAWVDVACLGELGRPACSLTGANPLTTLPGGSWGKLSKWGKFLGKHAGSRKRLEPRFSVPMCLTPSLLPWNQTTQSRDEAPGLGGPWLQLHSSDWR